ncbi:MAG: winged helix-turn-helix transcriptional regulator [Microthrixaceae bacterium]|nr:winged helix-turn-helix transcriptional regulator [Microthrixaceae bacterium]
MTAVAEPPDLDALFGALADPTRRAIVARLTSGEATIKELAEPHDMTPQAISQHARVLEEAGLITRGRHRQTRPCRLEPDHLLAVTSWVEARRAEWEDRHDRLADHLAQLQEEQP